MLVSTHNRHENEFEALRGEIAAAETSLRSHFENTPPPAPEAVARIKSRLREEMRQGIPARSGRIHWLRWGSGVAAALLIAAGVSLYYPSQTDRRVVTKPGPSEKVSASAEASLDTFASTVARAAGDEDPAVGQLNGDLKELESQTRRTWDDSMGPADPSAQQSGNQPDDGSMA
jgi:hypothetical protein